MRIVISALIAALLLVVPAAASASERSGSATDPVGDNTSGFPWQDIISADAQYNTDGELIVAARMNGDLKNGQPATYLQFRVAQYVAPSDCTGEGVFLAGYSDDQYDYVKVDGIDDPGSEPIAYAGNDDIVFDAQGSALANKGYSCMTLYVQQKGSDQVVDQLDVPLWFDGYGPSKGDGGGTDNGGGGNNTNTQTPAATCKAPNVKGKTLAAAKKLLAKAHCKLGKVTKPKHPKKGARLVVTKQRTNGSSVLLTLGVKH
jgi:hypothetical protein